MSADEEVVVNTRLAGTRQFLADTAAEAAGIKALDEAVDHAGGSMDKTSKRSFLMNQALFTMRRFLYSGTIAMAAMGSAAIAMGISFNSTMEMNTVSIAHFVGSVSLAHTELNSLYKLAATTPFEFSNVTDAAKRFLAFGFSLQDTNKYLRILGDTAAGLGLGNEGISRLVLVFGQMQASGRVLGGDLLQLAQAGVPALQILQKQLHLTQEQMANIGQLRIPSAVAIPALMKGLSQQFKGLAAEQARTFQGQLSTLHDYASQLLGTLTLPLFNSLKDRIFPRMNVIIGAMQQAAKQGGLAAAVRAMDEQITPRSHRILTFYTQLTATLGDLRAITLGLTGALKGSSAVVAGILAPLAIFRGLLIVAAHTTSVWVPLLQVVLIYLLAYRSYLIGAAVARGTLNAIENTGIAIEKTMNLVFLIRARNAKIAEAAMRLYTVATKGYLLVDGRFAKMTMLEKFMLRMRFRVLTARSALLSMIVAIRAAGAAALSFFALNPELWIAVAVLAAVVGLVLLYQKWQWFHNAVNTTFDWIKTHWPLLLAIITGPFGLAVLLIVRNFDTIKNTAKAVINWIVDKFEWLGSKLKRFFGKIPGLGKLTGLIGKIPGLARGGTVLSPGLTLVGERGPELLALPAGATVSPNPELQPIFNFPEAWRKDNRPIQIVVELDGRVVSENTLYYQESAEARR